MNNEKELPERDASAPDRGSNKPKPSMARRFIRRMAFIGIIFIAFILVLSMTASRPDNLGVTQGQLAECPDKPNCVSTQSSDPVHSMPAVPFSGNGSKVIAKIKNIVESEFPRAKLVSETDHYLHYEFTSLVFRFIDDVEFFVDDKASVVHFRSASRVGQSDLGANRKRMSLISESLQQ